MQKRGKKKQESGLRCCHPSRVNDEDWIDPGKDSRQTSSRPIPAIQKQSTILRRIAFLQGEVTSSCDIPDSIESNAHNLALDGGEMAMAGSLTQTFSQYFQGNGGDFFHGFLFYCGLIKMAWRVKRNFPWQQPWPKATNHYNISYPLTRNSCSVLL